MKKTLLLLVAVLGLWAACSDNENTSTEYANWSARNATAFVDTLRRANADIALAKSHWGNAWEDHCPWRVYASYTIAEGAKTTWRDSIAVRVQQVGTGSGHPLFTDTVRVAYVGRLMPTPETPAGYVFDYSGLTDQLDQAFLPEFLQTRKMGVGSSVEGFTTALQHMNIGDRWRIFIPADMGYGSTTQTKIPGGSMLIFDLELKHFWRPGHKPL